MVDEDILQSPCVSLDFAEQISTAKQDFDAAPFPRLGSPFRINRPASPDFTSYRGRPQSPRLTEISLVKIGRLLPKLPAICQKRRPNAVQAAIRGETLQKSPIVYCQARSRSSPEASTDSPILHRCSQVEGGEEPRKESHTMKRSAGDSTPKKGCGSVSIAEVMTLREFGRRLGLGQRACCDAQRQGLRTVLFGRSKFVLGQDVVPWFRRLAEDQEHQRQTEEP
jgi:hypothetical protein